MTTVSILDRVRLAKSAVDAGFDVKVDAQSDWLLFASTSCPLRVALTVRGQPIVALSMSNVLEELGLPAAALNVPKEFPGAVVLTDMDDLQRTLARSYALANSLPQQLLHNWQEKVRSLPATEREATIKQRIGQNLFRHGLLALWQGCCAVTGLAIPELLRASHAKPWSVATDEERLDVYNGILLAAHLDAAFDCGLITFTSTGDLQVSARLGNDERVLLGLDRSWARVALRPQHQPYLEFHREHVYGSRE